MFGVKAVKILVCIGAVAVASLAFAQASGASPGVGAARYATDAYPGFDTEDENIKPERKDPHWWWWMCGGPARETAADQFAYCRELVKEESYSKARSQLDNLVRKWPTAPEAWRAQNLLADLLLEKLHDTEEAFKEYRYLLDFYSLQCDYKAIADRLCQVARLMEVEGKEVMFIRFANTVEVRRAYETCVLRAPGEKWVPEAMLTIARLREDEGKPAEAVKVYENLRNLHPGTDESLTALLREAEVRMSMLRDHEYNRARCRDTIDFMKLALRSCRPDDARVIQGYLEEAQGIVEREAYREAKFYDSPTRTKRSAVAAYEKFLAEYPTSVHADEVRARMEELKGETK